MYYMDRFLLTFPAACDDDWSTDSVQATLLPVLSCERSVRGPNHYRYPAHVHTHFVILGHRLFHVWFGTERWGVFHVLSVHVSLSYLLPLGWYSIPVLIAI